MAPCSPHPSSFINEVKRVAGKSKQRLPIIHFNCAGNYIGSREHWVAVEPDKVKDLVRCFSSFTDSLNELADWLELLTVKTVAKKVTGVYWMPFVVSLKYRTNPIVLNTCNKH